ncbi:MAG TPA: cytochrome c oxidase assembly factor Coa1 family protein [Terracidiphilus sp.]|nr:cytochrome c oxidase assembly factor Coa1 family protein [Terracidiphilus sp.]
MIEKAYCRTLIILMIICLLCVILIPEVRTSREAWTFAVAQMIGIAANLLCIRFPNLLRMRLSFLTAMPGRLFLRFLLLSPIFLFVLCALFDFGERRSALFKDAIHNMEESQAARADLGVPIKIGWPIQGEMDSGLTGDSGHSTLLIPVSGNHGEGTLRVLGTKTNGVWTIHEITLVLRDSNVRESLGAK